jgi:hypothetical protein
MDLLTSCFQLLPTKAEKLPKKIEAEKSRICENNPFLPFVLVTDAEE